MHKMVAHTRKIAQQEEPVVSFLYDGLYLISFFRACHGPASLDGTAVDLFRCMLRTRAPQQELVFERSWFFKRCECNQSGLYDTKYFFWYNVSTRIRFGLDRPPHFSALGPCGLSRLRNS